MTTLTTVNVDVNGRNSTPRQTSGLVPPTLLSLALIKTYDALDGTAPAVSHGCVRSVT